MLYLREVPNAIRFLEMRVQEIFKKADGIDAVAGHLDEMPVKELMLKVETLETKAARPSSFERGDNSSSSVAVVKMNNRQITSPRQRCQKLVVILNCGNGNLQTQGTNKI